MGWILRRTSSGLNNILGSSLLQRRLGKPEENHIGGPRIWDDIIGELLMPQDGPANNQQLHSSSIH